MHELDNILIKRQRMHGADTYTLTGLENKLNCQAQRVDQQHQVYEEASHSLVQYPGDTLDRGQYCSTTSFIMWMIKQRAPTASSIIIQNWGVRLIHQENQLSFRGTSTGWKEGLRSSKGSAKTST